MAVGVKVQTYEQRMSFLREAELMMNEHPAVQALVAWGNTVL
jgi:hypothetical protein